MLLCILIIGQGKICFPLEREKRRVARSILGQSTSRHSLYGHALKRARASPNSVNSSSRSFTGRADALMSAARQAPSSN